MVVAGVAGTAEVLGGAGVVEHCEVGDTFRAHVVLLAKSAVADRTSHCLASVVLQLVVSLTFLTQLELGAAGAEGNRAAHAGVVAQLVVSSAG